MYIFVPVFSPYFTYSWKHNFNMLFQKITDNNKYETITIINICKKSLGCKSKVRLKEYIINLNTSLCKYSSAHLLVFLELCIHTTAGE